MVNRIIDKLRSPEHLFSLEVFPPKKEHRRAFELVVKTVDALCQTSPAFISVTYGAGGSNKGKVVEIAGQILQRKILPLSHLTAVGFSKEEIQQVLDQLYDSGVRNVLALRGDIPPGAIYPQGAWRDFRYALDLIRWICQDSRFCVGAATYPEGHPSHRDPMLSVTHLAEKAYAGADFFVSQLFFENALFIRFMENVERLGLKQPIIPGIMPIVKINQVQKILELSGATIPSALQKTVDRYQDHPESLMQAGIDFAVKQIIDLQENGIRRVHLYTMNQPKPVLEILEQTKLIDSRGGW